MGVRTQLDGWSLGFNLLGLKYTIEFEIALSKISGEARLSWAQAEWKRPAAVDRQIIDLDDTYRRPIGSKTQGPEQLLQRSRKRLLKALGLAVMEGFQPQRGILGMVTAGASKSPLATRLRQQLTPQEDAVYQAWLAHLQAQGIKPIRIRRWQPLCGVRPGSPQTDTQGALKELVGAAGDDAEALVDALYSADDISPALLGSGLEVLEEVDFDWPQWEEWREFYRQNPDGHGSCVSLRWALRRIGRRCW